MRTRWGWFKSGKLAIRDCRKLFPHPTCKVIDPIEVSPRGAQRRGDRPFFEPAGVMSKVFRGKMPTSTRGMSGHLGFYGGALLALSQSEAHGHVQGQIRYLLFPRHVFRVQDHFLVQLQVVLFG